MTADAPTRTSMLAEGRQFATARRPEMRHLIVKNPQLALEMAVPDL